MEQYIPLEDRCLVRPKKETELEKTDSGIIIPDSVKKEVKEGEIVSIGEGKYAQETGTFMPTFLHKGDRILFGAHQGMPITINKEDLLIMRESDVLLLLPKKDSTE